MIGNGFKLSGFLLRGASTITLVAAAASPASAAILTWDGNVSADWTDGDNWDTGNTPGSADWATISLSSGATAPVLDDAAITVGAIFVGSEDGSSLEVRNGATVNVGTTLIGNPDTNSQTGADLESGTVTITGDDTVWLSSDTTSVGFSGQGILNVEEGASFSSTKTVTLGSNASGVGTINVSGAGTEWTTTGGGLVIGGAGDGTFNVSDGAHAIDYSATIAQDATSTGMVSISGEDTLWQVTTGALVVGNRGEGTLEITDGAQVEAGYRVYVGNYAGETGNLLISGEGSSLKLTGTSSLGTAANHYFMAIGNNAGAEGVVTVEGGGTLEAAHILAGYLANSTGTLVVDGEGSTVHAGTYLIVGYQGTGEATLSNGANITVDDQTRGIYIAYAAGSTGTLNIGAAADEEAAAAGTVDAAKIIFGAGNGTLVFNHSDEDYIFSAAFSGAGTIDHLSGETILTGTSTGFTGDLNVEGGSLELTGTLSADDITIGDGSFTVSGAGSLFADEITVDGGAVTLSGGSATVGQVDVDTGSFDLSGGTLTVDQVNIGDGSFTLSGDGVLAAQDITIAYLDGTAGSFNIGAAADEDAAAAGTIESGAILLNEGGTLVFNHTSEDYVFSAAVSGAGTIAHLAGDTIFTGDNPDFTGDLTVEGGSLELAGTLGADAVTVEGGSFTLSGNGVLAANEVHLDGGSFALAGGSLSAELIDVDGGAFSLSSGSATVDEVQVDTGNFVLSGGTLTVDQLNIGDGSFTFSGSGVLAAQDITIAYLDGTEGSFNIGAAADEAAAAAGSIESGEFHLNEGGTLVFNHTGSLEFGSVVSGTGGEILHVAGVTDFTGNSSGYTGSIDLLGGTLKANGDLSGAAVSVGAGAVLGGGGTIGSLVVGDGGTLAPGNSPGQLTVVGDVLFESGSIFNVEIDGAVSDSILVESGDVTIEQGALLNASFVDGVLLDHAYQVVVLGDGSTGEITVEGSGFALPTETNPLLEGVVDYNDEGITVTYQGISSPWGALLDTANQAAAANAVQALGGDNSLYYASVFLGQNELAAAFNGLSGEIHASAKSALIEESRILRSVAMDRSANSDDGVGLWATGFADWGSSDGDANSTGLDRDSRGVFVGLDAKVGDWRLGVLGGYSTSDFDADGVASSGESESYHLGVYAGGSFGKLRLRAALSHSWHDVSTLRTVAFPTVQTLAADYEAGTTQLFGEAGYAFSLQGFEIEPYAGLAFVSLKTDGYTEIGGTAALSGDRLKTEATFGTLGLRGSATLGAASLKGLIGWRHAFDDTPTAVHGFAASAAPFSVTGATVDEDAVLAEIGVNFPLGENIKFNLGYKGQFGDKTTDHNAMGGLSIRF